jgi:comEA protein
MSVHIRIICVWIAGIAGLWVALYFKNEAAKPIGVIVTTAPQEEQNVYFDAQTPVFESKEPIAETKKIENKTVKTDKKRTVAVNINTAGIKELTTLPEIGTATAQKIIDYRKAKGNFVKIEDLKLVSGIGEKKFEAVKEFLRLQESAQ